MTLNEISENIAFALGGQYNDTLKQAIKHTVIVYRAKLIKDDLARNFMDYTNYLQSFIVDLDLKNPIEGYCDKCRVLRTINKVPTPIRTTLLDRSGFAYVGQLDTNNAFVFTKLEEFKFLKSLQYQHGVTYFAWDNGYIYVLDNSKLCAIRVEAAFTDPRSINMTCTEKSTMFRDDRQFPISASLLVTIEKGIINGDYPVITDGKRVNLEEEINK